MRRLSYWVLCSALALTVSGGCIAGRHPALAVLDPAQYAGTDDAGALPTRFVSPYFANLTAWWNLREGGETEPVRRYLEWYLDTLNYPDRWGLTGTIYDYEVSEHGETPTGSYDSADSYSATFLLLLEEYWLRSGDGELARRHAGRIADIAWLMIHLQDPDGLVRAVPWDEARYLMDNCEDYGGLRAMSRLCRIFGWEGAERYDTAAEAVRLGIMQDLGPDDRLTFHWASAGPSRHESKWETYYPDAYAQLFPVLYGVVSPDSEQARRIWENFRSRWDPRDGHEVEAVQRIVIEMTREQVEQ